MTTTTAPAAAKPRFSGADGALLLGVLGFLCLALVPVRIHRAFGLPAHPLLLHIPVVLVPLLGIALLVAAVRPSLFDRYSLTLGAFTVVTLASTILTVGAGQAFRQDRRGGPGEFHRLSEHAHAGETLRLVMIAVAAVVLGAVLLEHAKEGTRLAFLSGLARSGALRTALRVLFAVGAVAAIFFVIRTGHLGAQVTWQRGFGGRPPPGFFDRGGNRPPGAP